MWDVEYRKKLISSSLHAMGVSRWGRNAACILAPPFDKGGWGGENFDKGGWGGENFGKKRVSLPSWDAPHPIPFISNCQLRQMVPNNKVF